VHACAGARGLRAAQAGILLRCHASSCAHGRAQSAVGGVVGLVRAIGRARGELSSVGCGFGRVGGLHTPTPDRVRVVGGWRQCMRS
jgi:hypothetical protein